MLNSNKYKSLLILVCVGIIAIPFIKIILPTPTAETQKSASVSGSVSVSSSASGIFIVPPGGKEVSRDTAGYRAALHNIGDRIVAYTQNPKALYLVDENGELTRIEGQQTVIEVCTLGKKDYVIFTNLSGKTAKVKVKIIPRHL